ncbi:MAG: YfhO family protein [Elusimicrobiota bacterium]
MLTSNDYEPSKTIFIENQTNINSSNLKSEIIVLKNTPKEILINAELSDNGFLFLSNTYYPGWKAFIDGTETKIIKANYTFQAVTVQEGKHIVKFCYRPGSFKIGLIISLLFLCGTIWVAKKTL